MLNYNFSPSFLVHLLLFAFVFCTFSASFPTNTIQCESKLVVFHAPAYGMGTQINTTQPQLVWGLLDLTQESRIEAGSTYQYEEPTKGNKLKLIFITSVEPYSKQSFT